MALIQCPECGNQISDRATSCPKCGHPVSEVRSPAQETVKTPKVNEATKGTKDAEMSFYSDAHGVRITNTRAIFGSTTYAMNNIASVSMGFKPANRKHGFVTLLLGLLILLIGISANITVGLIFGAVVIILGIIILGSAKPSYSVRIGSASGEVAAFESKDEKYVQSIVQAMNEAIIKRG